MALAVGRGRAGWWLDLVATEALLGVLGSAGRYGSAGGWGHRQRLRGLSLSSVRACGEILCFVGELHRGGGLRRWVDVGRRTLIGVGDGRLMRELRHSFGVLVSRRVAQMPGVVLLVGTLGWQLLLGGKLVLLLKGNSVLLEGDRLEGDSVLLLLRR